MDDREQLQKEPTCHPGLCANGLLGVCHPSPAGSLPHVLRIISELPVIRSVIPAAGILGRTRREFVTREATEQLQ
jgi:hypothetical protein